MSVTATDRTATTNAGRDVSGYSNNIQRRRIVALDGRWITSDV